MRVNLENSLIEISELAVKMHENFYLKFMIERAGNEILVSLKNGGKILIAGNGGSAAEAQHFAAELVGRFKTERIALPAIALTTDTSILTAIGNDYGYDTVFDRQVQALGNAQDILVVMSTSGNSPNIISCVNIAKQKNLKVVALLGKDGGKLKDIVDFPIVIPSGDTARIQEMHLLIIHAWCSFVDANYDTIK